VKRVLLVLGLSGFGALVAATVLPPGVVLTLAIFCAAAGIMGLCLPAVRRRSLAYGAGLLAASVALCLFAQKEFSDYRPTVAKAGQTVWIEATVAETPSVTADRMNAGIEVTAGDLTPGTRIYFGMTWRDGAPSIGDVVTGTVRLSEADPTPSEPMTYGYSKASGVYLSAWEETEGAVTVTPADPAVGCGWMEDASDRLRAIRDSVNDLLTGDLPPDVRGLVSAVCLGRRSELSDSVTAAFRKSGVSHLLVVSGLHVSFVSMGLYAALRRLRLRRRTASVAALIAMLVFGALVGWRASVVRSCVLIASLLIGRCFRRPADSVNSLGGGLLVLWLVDPYCVYDLGLWLSFGATAGLIFLYPWMWRYVSKARLLSRKDSVLSTGLRGAAKVLCVSLSASLPTCPLVAFFYGEISLVSPLTNLLTVWVAAWLLYLAGFSLLFSPLGLGSLLSVPTAALSRYLLWVTRTLAGWNGAVWNTRDSYVQLWILGALLLLGLGWRLRRGRGLRMAAAIAVIVLCAGTLIQTVRMQGVTALSAYNRFGSVAVAAQIDGGNTVLAVSGNGQSWKAALRLLDARGVSAVDEVIVTDPGAFSATEWKAFDESVAVGRYFLTVFEPDTAARLMTGDTPVMLTPGDDEPTGAWRWNAEEKTLTLTFGDSRAVLTPKLENDFSIPERADTLTLAMTAYDRQPLTGDGSTPAPGQRQVWYTRGEGDWKS